MGVAERSAICDGSRIGPGDAVLAVASNGLHTNGYSLVRALLERRPELARRDVDGEPFIDVVMRPHTCYYQAMRGLFGTPGLHGLAHITGGGLHDNVIRVLPAGVDVHIDLSTLRVPNVFRVIAEEGHVATDDMLRTFNMGCGLVVICDAAVADATIAHFADHGHACWQVGAVVEGSGEVLLEGELQRLGSYTPPPGGDGTPNLLDCLQGGRYCLYECHCLWGEHVQNHRDDLPGERQQLSARR